MWYMNQEDEEVTDLEETLDQAIDSWTESTDSNRPRIDIGTGWPTQEMLADRFKKWWASSAHFL